MHTRLIDAGHAQTETAGRSVIRLREGRRAEFRRDGADDLLVVSSSDGRVELSVRFTEAGPVFSVAAAALRLQSAGEVAVECESFRVNAAQGMNLHSGGDARVEAAGEARIIAGDDAGVEGHAVELRARRGNVDLQANDDVRLRGERVKLNC